MGWPERGSYRFVGEKSLAKVFTYKVRNKLSAVAHDLELHTRAIEGSVKVESDSVQVEVTIGLWGLSVKEGMLSRLEKGECERILRKKVLKKEGKAWARFQGSGSPNGETVTMEGTLTLLEGRSRPVKLACSVDVDPDGGYQVTLKQELLQTDYGIKPYTALMGALKLQDRIEVEIAARLTPA